MLYYNDAFVWQYDGEEESWTYDDTVWGVRLYMPEVAARSMDAVQYSLLLYPAFDSSTDVGFSFILDTDAGSVDEMTFTNIYTKSTYKPSENGTNTVTVTSSQTGDNSNLAVWFALLAVSAAGVMGAGVYSKRKRSAR